MDFEDIISLLMIIGAVAVLIFFGFCVIMHNRELMRLCLEEGNTEFFCRVMVRN